MRFTVAGRYWRLKWSRWLKAHWGLCYLDRREIVIRSNLNELNTLDTVIHELLHACDTDSLLSEEWVSRSATDIARVLHRLGCQLDPEAKKR